MIFVVRKDNVDEWWDKALPFVEKALIQGQGQYEYSVDWWGGFR